MLWFHSILILSCPPLTVIPITIRTTITTTIRTTITMQARLGLLSLLSLCRTSSVKAETSSCTVINDCNELRVALLDDGVVNVCANNNLSSIKCDETMGSSLARIYLNNNGVTAQQHSSYELNCVTSSNDQSSSSSCVIDFTPSTSYDGESNYG